MNEHYCIELRINEEDISSDIEQKKEHGHGFLHRHHHHDHSTYFDSDKWTAGGEIHPGLLTRSQIAPISSICGLADTKAVTMTEAAGIYDVSSNILNGSRRASTTEERRNPFAIREGSCFVWQNVNMTLNDKNGKREILNDVWGQLQPGKITAIMGISGAGKTSLLHVLSGRSQSSKKLTVESDIRMNKTRVDPSNIEVRKQIAFVTQDDALQSTSTPREAIAFSAKLRLPRITKDDEIKELTEKMIVELGLEECADTMIGGELVKGISGGERKRTSIGVELVTKPSLVFLDEPTSGLDSVSALQVINVLKKIAHAGCSVLFTIHQPSSEVFASFDNFILLNRGVVMYQGSVDKCPDFFAEHNYAIPHHYNPADFIMTIAQKYTKEMMADESFCTKNKLSLPADEVAKGEEMRMSLGVGKSTHTNDNEWKHVSFFTEVQLLFKREMKNTMRSKLVRARFALTTFISLLVGCIFYNVGNGRDINSHFGSMVMMLMISMFSTALPTLVGFSDERPVFLREYSTNHYSTVSYFISKLVMEALITLIQVLEILLVVYFMVDLQGSFAEFVSIEFSLAMASTATAVLVGCSVEDPKMAIEFMPVIFLPQILFAGLFVRTELIPVWLRWAQYLCALMYAVRLALLAEFGDCASMTTVQMPNPCKNLLEANMVEENDKAIYWAILWGLFVVFRLSGLIVLRKKATKFFD